MQRIDGPPRLLFKGADGGRTAGVPVRSLKPKHLCEDLGYSRTWHVNTHVFKREPERTRELLGLTEMEYTTLVDELERIERGDG